MLDEVYVLRINLDSEPTSPKQALFVKQVFFIAVRALLLCYCFSTLELLSWLQNFAKDGLVNLVGGCCGTTPAHIKYVCILHIPFISSQLHACSQ